jgi:hypothetical protein
MMSCKLFGCRVLLHICEIKQEWSVGEEPPIASELTEVVAASHSCLNAQSAGNHGCFGHLSASCSGFKDESGRAGGRLSGSHSAVEDFFKMNLHCSL